MTYVWKESSWHLISARLCDGNSHTMQCATRVHAMIKKHGTEIFRNPIFCADKFFACQKSVVRLAQFSLCWQHLYCLLIFNVDCHATDRARQRRLRSFRSIFGGVWKLCATCKGLSRVTDGADNLFLIALSIAEWRG